MLYCVIYPFYYQRLKNLVITSMKKTIFIAIFLGLLASGGFFYRWWQTTKVIDLRFTTVPEIQLVDNLTVEFANDANLSDFFASFTGQTFTDIPIDTGAIGEQVVTFAYRDQKNRLRHASFVLTVIDTVAPTALYSKYTMMVGENDDLIAQIPCGDNEDPHPVCELAGDYDPDVADTYELSIVTRDRSNNVGHQPLTLQIVEEYEESANPPLTFAQARAQYASSSIGIDVSRWQTEIDWQAVKDSGVDFAIIRLGSQTKFDAEPTIDPYFAQNLAGARAVALPVGVYFYSLAKTSAQARAQADWVIQQLAGTQLDLPVVFDWEAWTYWNELDLSYYSLNQLATEFLQTVTAAGYQGMLYGSKLPLQRIWWNKNNYPVWLAHYVTATDYDGAYDIWQFSATGEISGIDGDVDLNLMVNAN